MSKRRSTEGVAEFPTRQLFILSLCRISESVAFMSIFPYVYYMIASFKIAEGDHQIAIYAGMVTSAFTLAEFSTGVMWGRLSDRIGRKPVLLIGFAGTGLSMLIFGFATNLTVALIGRAVGGFLNGNMGVLATSVAEMITVKEHQPRAYAVMPFVWSLGSILGPALGGALAEPCNNYPNIFHRGTIFDKFPYLLPNLVCAMFIVCGVVIGLLFLEETHELKKHQRDLGLELGDWILRKIRYYISWCKAPSTNQSKVAESSWDEHQVLLFDEETQDSTPTPPTSQLSLAFSEEMPIPSCKKSFTRPVVLHIIAFALLAYHTISFDQLMPIFLSMPLPSEPVRLPFRFSGGFDLSTKSVGTILSFLGFFAMINQIYLCPKILSKKGALPTFRMVAIFFPIIYLFVPFTVLLPASIRLPAIIFCHALKISSAALAYPSNTMLITNSVSTTLVLGMVNGVGASAASLARAIGPLVTGFIHSKGLELGYNGLAWWCAALVAIIAAFECLLMQETKGRLDTETDGDACIPMDAGTIS